MVAISLYRGNLHRVPDIPRRYTSPSPKISLKDFKKLLSRRNSALSRHLSVLDQSVKDCNLPDQNENKLKIEDDPQCVVDSNLPNQNENNVKIEDHDEIKIEGSDLGLEGNKIEAQNLQEINDHDGEKIEGSNLVLEVIKIEGEKLPEGTNGGDDLERINGSDSIMEEAKIEDGELVKSPVVEKPLEGMDMDQIDGSDLVLELTKTEGGDVVGSSVEEKPPEPIDVKVAPSDTEKRKKEIEEKLEVLNAKKHDLVQVLKQILNAEEELKRRNSTQGMGMRPSIPLQVDVTADSGSLSRLTTPRLNSDGNLASDIERGETDETSHHNTQSRHLVRTSSVSPSSDSLHKRPVFSAVPHPRASVGGVGSPSRFAPVGHPMNLPTASGTSYIASSPSPAASGGTSAFRESRQPSPWN